MSFDLDSREERSDLVHVVRYLLELRVLERIDGDEQLFVNSSKDDVLYNVNRSILAMLLNVRRGPSTVDAKLSLAERMQLLIEEQRPETEDARNRELRLRLTRRLLDDPVIYFDDLDEAELDYFIKQRGRVLRRVEEASGLVAEVRVEGIAMLDDQGDLSDLDVPKDGTEGHFTLLVAEFLARRIRQHESVQVGLGEIQEHASRLIQEHSKHWRKSVRAAGAERSLVADALNCLEGLRLIVRESDVVIVRPAIARYGIGNVEGAQEGRMDSEADHQQMSLWESKQ